MNSIKNNFFYNAAFQILSMILPLITTPYVSRVLGADGIGKYSYAYSVTYYFVIVILLGLNNYGNREIAKVRDDSEKMSRSFCNMYISQFSIGIFVLLVYSIYSSFYASDKVSAIILGLYVVSGVLDINWFFYGIENFKLTVIRNTGIKIFSFIAIFLFVKTSGDVYIYCFILALSALLSQIAIWPFLIKNVKLYKPNIEEAIIHLKGSLKLFVSVIAVSLFKVMDKIMLGILSGYSQVGFYESSERIINIPIALISALGTVMLPRMTYMFSHNKQGGSKIIKYSVLFAMFISSSLCFGIMGVSNIFVPLFYGNGYELCIRLYMILLPSCLFLAFANVIRTQYLLPMGMDKKYIISAFLGAIVNFTINYLLIPSHGAIGAAIGTLIAEGVVCFYQCFVCRHGVNVVQYFILSLPMICSGIIMLIVLRLISFSIISPFLQLIIKIIIGAAVYLLTLILQLFIFRKHYRDFICDVRAMVVSAMHKIGMGDK